ncbi:autotransporter assembly complex family protein [Pseudomonas sp. RIT-PI-S]|uniref:autotransporter assembly complex protein TamA n=1 Tax=Pseudomonas sp. RIT-PI-S TaxID=3035295 RepID=UPI0021D7E7D6|nr:autotransporter assembly complex family protein [Pseudomonas sp. RIT-PI-S]
MKHSGRTSGGLLLACLAANAAAQSRLQVELSPPNPALRANIEAYVGNVADRDEHALQQLRRIAEAQARDAVEALGFYHAVIHADVRGGAEPALRVRVQPGEPVRLREVSVRIDGPAAAMPEFRVPRSPALAPGMPLNHGHYEDAKRLILNQASRFGFFDGHFEQQQLRVDPAAGTADIALHYLSGPRYHFGEVAFKGDSIIDTRLLQRMVPFKAGDPYNADLVAQLNHDLQSSGYFQGVTVEASPQPAEGQRVPVQVDLAARAPRTLGLGGGFSTDVGPRLKANWTRHWVNAQGHSYGAEAELSAPRQNVGLWYDVPLASPLTDKLRYAAGYQYEEIADTDSLSKLLTVGPEWHSKLPGGWQRVISLKWQREEYRLGDDAGLSNLVMPGISYSYLHSDSRVDPNNGYRLQFDAQVAKEGLLSDANLLHADVQLRGLTTLFERHRFLARLQVGGSATNGYKAIPPSLRFFAGGDQTVRGYDYQSLSPENSDGDRIGGRYMVAGTAEYQYSFAPKWRVATFIDQGNAFNSLDLPSLKTGVGVGLRWVSPVGPIRVDVARGLDDGGGFRLHFSMGPEL